MTSTEKTIRAFVAAMLPADVQEALVLIARDLAATRGLGERTLRWVRPEGLHLTFHFESALPIKKVDDVLRAMKRAADRLTPIDLRARGIGAFPNVRRPRVVWAGVEGDLEALSRLARGVEREMKAIGLRPDKPFKPHLTLGRVRDGVSGAGLEALSEALISFGTTVPTASNFTVNQLTFVQSTLDPSGSIYNYLGTAELAGKPE
jgi:2'-5' RNA ligase